eukprot:2950005-Prymnesium_polylepis.1
MRDGGGDARFERAGRDVVVAGRGSGDDVALLFCEVSSSYGDVTARDARGAARGALGAWREDGPACRAQDR